MSVWDKIVEATERKDAEIYAEILHPDYEFVSHQSGTSFSKGQMIEMMKGMMASDKMAVHNPRCIYENDDILVEHSVMDFPDSTSEAVLAVHTIQGGLIVRTETGATLLSK
tara:strand:+ start:1006 stop:1338 length:333 start_codon:yes stop_codon:yes gene_type:complete